jgi:hypothetical protein
MCRLIGWRAVVAAGMVILIASCGGGKPAAQAFARSGDDAFRVAPRILDDLPSSQMRSQLDDLTLQSNYMPSTALESEIVLSASVDDVSAAAVAESTTMVRLRDLIDTYGDDAYSWTCEVIDVVDFLADNGTTPSVSAVRNVMIARTGQVPDVPIESIHTLIMGTGDRSDAAGQVLLWASCLAAE